MFYPENSLKRGGRFYLCWVADSWPLRFASITPRQLWSYDIRKICDDLLKMMTTESGHPRKRFSLRLSSQLLRGLVRFYHRKVDVFLGDLCMLNAFVIKKTNKKWELQEPKTAQPISLPVITIEEPENEPRVEELILSSNNVVANIEDITLREPMLPENQLLINDGFGELRTDQVSPDKTIEMMMRGDASDAQRSALELPDFSVDKSHDKSRLGPHDAAQMERISEHDVSMFRKSIGTDLLPIGDFEKDIPEIPEIPPPDLNVPQLAVQNIDVPITEREVSSVATKRPILEEIVLEELEEEPRAKRRRLRSGLIIDEKIKLTSDYLRSRIDNVAVELRCKRGCEETIKILIPTSRYFTRPAHGGERLRPNLSPELTFLFHRNLGVSRRTPLADREIEVAVTKPTAVSHNKSQLEMTEDKRRSESLPVDMQMEIEENVRMERSVRDEVPAVGDVWDLQTQIVETISQLRTSECEIPTKRSRGSGATSFRLSQRTQLEAVSVHEADKENIPQNMQIISESQRNVTTMLQKAGLADAQTKVKDGPVIEPPIAFSDRRVTGQGSDSSETPLGSLDRTKVSLGDSEKTTDSQGFICDQWGTEGTMVKIINAIKDGRTPIDIRKLVALGPILQGYKNIITARCFTSVLKLKQHGFVNLRKDPSTLEILDITLGPKFDGQVNW
ncbi:sister chromatid cohesion protein 1-like [Battus philenor]|uniref:sister chromatid cohesion protein 1-like n=1 Tax=Battus philenor TaxID=42288 RepID=UPI0035CF46BB